MPLPATTHETSKGLSLLRSKDVSGQDGRCRAPMDGFTAVLGTKKRKSHHKER